MRFNPGDRICNTTLLRRCGSGSYGEVWLAEDAIGTRVALKIIPRTGNASERELAGLKNYRECNHPNLLKIRYVELNADYIFCIMDAADNLNGDGEYIPDTLTNRLRRDGRMEGREILRMLDGLLDGLEELHRRGLVHRDIKPDNIIWVNGRPTLADAGLIAISGQSSLVGTPGFLSDKLMRGLGSADAGDDFYALGKVIYCALTGMPVEKFPSLPMNVTISSDSELNRASLEACRRPVRSTREFRRLLAGESRNPVPDAAPSPGGGALMPRAGRGYRAGIGAVLILTEILIVAGIFAYRGCDTATEDTDDARAAAAPPLPARREALPTDPGRRMSEAGEILAGVKDTADRLEFYGRVTEFLKEHGYFTQNHLKELLNHTMLSEETIVELLLRSGEFPRLKPPPHEFSERVATPLERKLAAHFTGRHPEPDEETLRRQQEYWLSRCAELERRHGGYIWPEIQVEMIACDPAMWEAALDMEIGKLVNRVLDSGCLWDGDEAALDEMLAMLREMREIDGLEYPVMPGLGEVKTVERTAPGAGSGSTGVRPELTARR